MLLQLAVVLEISMAYFRLAYYFKQSPKHRAKTIIHVAKMQNST